MADYINLDAEPDLGSHGLFLVGGAVWGGRTAAGDGAEAGRHTLEIETTVGAYVTAGEAHQILLQYDVTAIPRPEVGGRRLEVGSVALGYNVVVQDAVELIHEVSLDLPGGDARYGVGVFAGFIATLE